MSSQNPQQCKDSENSEWMYNRQDQTPCQVLASSIHQFDPSYNLTWLDLSFTCPRRLTQSNTSTVLSRQLSDFCCSSVSFSLFSSCWACQWDQPVQGYVRTTWDDYSSTCLPNTTTGTVLATARIGTLTTAVQSALTAANIDLPSWLFLPMTGGSTWDEASAKANATVIVMQSNSPSNHLSTGAIAGISIGSFILFCILVFAFTVVCMRKQQRHRLETFRHRSASIFGHNKKRVVNMREKTGGSVGRGGMGVRAQMARMDLARGEDEALASPVSAKGAGTAGFGGARRVNSDLTMDISHEAMLPALLGGHEPTRGMGLGAPASGVGGVPQRQRTPIGSDLASRLSTNVRRSLARLGRRSQPEQVGSSQAPGVASFPAAATASHFAVPFSSDQQQQQPSRMYAGRPMHSAPAPLTAWPHDTTHPLTQQQLHPQLSRYPSGPPTSSGSHGHTMINDKPTPMPLTKEALQLARVAQDGTLFVMGDPDVKRGGKTRGAPMTTTRQGALGQPGQTVPTREYIVRTVSIERNPAQMQRHVEMTPRRSDSLRRSEVPAQTQGQRGQHGQTLVLHESLMDGSVPKRKTPSRQRLLDDELNVEPAAASSSSAPRLPGLSFSKPSPIAPVARKPVPKSDSSVKANAGSAVGSNGGTEAVGEDDESIAALELRNITGSATATSGSGSANGNGNGRHGKGKKRVWGRDDIRMSIAANTSLSSAALGGVKSDGTRTPSPKVAPSAEWFDLFRRGTAPTFTSNWGAEEGIKTDLLRNKTAPVPTVAASSKKPTFQPSVNAGPSMPMYERTRTQSSTAAEQASSFYRTPIAALYSSTSSLTALASSGNTAMETGIIRRQLSAQNLVENTPAPAPIITNSEPISGPSTPILPSPKPAFRQAEPGPRALPTISTLPVARQLPSIGVQPNIPTPAAAANSHQMDYAPSASQPISHRRHPSIPLPIPPSASGVAASSSSSSSSFPSPPRAAPAGARPVRRLPAIPPQSPTSG